MKNNTHKKYFKEIIYERGDTKIILERSNANLNVLIEILKEKPLTRKELIIMTNWTRGQIAGLLNRGQKKGVILLKNRKIYLTSP